jgi:hypothetical protein
MRLAHIGDTALVENIIPAGHSQYAVTSTPVALG